MHIHGAYLNLERLTVRPDHRGMQRLVHVGPGDSNEILNPSWNRPPQVVYESQGSVTVFHRGGNDAHRKQVIHLLDWNLLALDLLMDAVNSFDSGLNGSGDLVLLQ